jgi:WD40 repeat protein
MGVIRGIVRIVLILFWGLGSTQMVISQSPPQFPAPDFVLRSDFDKGKGHTEVSFNEDKNGKATGNFAVYGDPNLSIQLESLSFSADGSMLAVGSTPNIVDLWDLPNHTRLKSFVAGSSVALSPNGAMLATDGIAIWDTKTSKQLRRIVWTGDTIKRLYFSPSGALLSVTSNGADDMIYDVQSGRKLETLLHTREGQFSSDGSIFVGANRETLTVWQVDGWKPLHVFPTGPYYVTTTAISPDKKTVVIGGPHGTKIVDLSNGALITQFGDGYVSSVSFVADGAAVMVSDAKGKGIWNFKGQAECSDTKLESGVALLSPGDRWLVMGAQHQRDVLLWKGESLKTACPSLLK